MEERLSAAELKDFLEAMVLKYNTVAFINGDPISIPHQYSLKEDIEVSGFLSATIAWGKRELIARSGLKLMDLIGNAPFDFVMSHTEKDLDRLSSFVYRTFQSQDLLFFIKALKNIYLHHGGLERVFTDGQTATNMHESIAALRSLFLQTEHQPRSRKHIADTTAGSAAKRIHMYLRWMVRRDNKGVDFGLWKDIPMSILSCPLDLHSATVSRKLGLLERKQNDLKAVNELDKNLRALDPLDPVKYDFALFGLGIFDGF